MDSNIFLSASTFFSGFAADFLFIGLTLFLLLASLGLIAVCDRLMEDSK
jgi:hypothetical protein